jgi:peptidoglycan/xylan/chitin deacetylase (PgdA/CDA1 family)
LVSPAFTVDSVNRPRLLLSIDFEDWHQLVHRRLGLPDWDRPHAALERQTAYLLDLLDELGARATFFLLGMSVVNQRELVAEIMRRGHDPACHGYVHARVYEQTREEFRADVERAFELIAETTGRRPVAYRAPAFSINRRTPWAYEVLAELGFRYDSSQYDSPRVPDRLGDIPAEPYRLGALWELPVTGGGSYWRVLPPRGLHDLAVLYFHPYEFGPALRAELPPGEPLRRRLTAAKLVLWRNAGRGLIEKRLRRIAQAHRLVSYDQAYGDLDRLYGTRTRTLSPQGVLV